jgi:hypothetical protein
MAEYNSESTKQLETFLTTEWPAKHDPTSFAQAIDKFVIDGEAEPSSALKELPVAIILAVKHAPQALATLLPFEFSNQKEPSALMISAATGRNDDLKMLLKAGASVDAQDQMGNTALIYAAKKGNKEGVDGLLKAGADSTIKNNVGHSAIEYSEGAIKTTLQALANKQQKDQSLTTTAKHDTPLETAAKKLGAAIKGQHATTVKNDPALAVKSLIDGGYGKKPTIKSH